MSETELGLRGLAATTSKDGWSGRGQRPATSLERWGNERGPAPNRLGAGARGSHESIGIAMEGQ